MKIEFGGRGCGKTKKFKEHIEQELKEATKDYKTFMEKNNMKSLDEFYQWIDEKVEEKNGK